MNRILALLLIGVIPITSIVGQRLRNWQPTAGLSYSEKQFSPDNYRFLREADVAYRYDFERTFFALENAVAQNPQSADALIRRAIFKHTHGMEEEAQLDFDRANRINPYAADLYGYRSPFSLLNVIDHNPSAGLSYLNNDQRLNYYYQFLDRQFMDRENNAEELAKVEAIIGLVDQGALKEAMLQVDNLLTTYPNSPLAYDLKGFIYLKQNDYPAAREALSKAVNLAPDFAIAWYNYGRVEKAEGNLQRAENYLNKAIILQADLTKARFDRALLRRELGDQEGALRDYDEIIAIQGENYLNAYLNRGLTKKMLGDFEGALSDLNLALDAYPEDPELYKNRGNLYLIFGYASMAIEDYSKAIEFREQFAEAYYNRGLAHIIRYDIVPGCDDLQKSVDLGSTEAKEKMKYFCVE